MKKVIAILLIAVMALGARRMPENAGEPDSDRKKLRQIT